MLKKQSIFGNDYVLRIIHLKDDDFRAVFRDCEMVVTLDKNKNFVPKYNGELEYEFSTFNSTFYKVWEDPGYVNLLNIKTGELINKEGGWSGKDIEEFDEKLEIKDYVLLKGNDELYKIISLDPSKEVDICPFKSYSVISSKLMLIEFSDDSMILKTDFTKALEKIYYPPEDKEYAVFSPKRIKNLGNGLLLLEFKDNSSFIITEDGTLIKELHNCTFEGCKIEGFSHFKIIGTDKSILLNHTSLKLSPPGYNFFYITPKYIFISNIDKDKNDGFILKTSDFSYVDPTCVLNPLKDIIVHNNTIILQKDGRVYTLT